MVVQAAEWALVPVTEQAPAVCQGKAQGTAPCCNTSSGIQSTAEKASWAPWVQAVAALAETAE